MVVGIDEGQTHVTLINPAHCLEEGDVLWVVAEKENIKRIQTTNE
jgi:trkA C-terminal domain protein